jgi:dUTPase
MESSSGSDIELYELRNLEDLELSSSPTGSKKYTDPNPEPAIPIPSGSQKRSGQDSPCPSREEKKFKKNANKDLSSLSKPPNETDSDEITEIFAIWEKDKKHPTGYKKRPKKQPNLGGPGPTTVNWGDNTPTFIVPKGAFSPSPGGKCSLGYNLPVQEAIHLLPKDFQVINLKISVVLPDNCHAWITPRFFAVQRGIGVIGGLIDRHYDGRLYATVVNHGKKPFHETKGASFLQIVIQKNDLFIRKKPEGWKPTRYIDKKGIDKKGNSLHAYRAHGYHLMPRRSPAFRRRYREDGKAKYPHSTTSDSSDTCIPKPKRGSRDAVTMTEDVVIEPSKVSVFDRLGAGRGVGGRNITRGDPSTPSPVPCQIGSCHNN